MNRVLHRYLLLFSILCISVTTFRHSVAQENTTLNEIDVVTREQARVEALRNQGRIGFNAARVKKALVEVAAKTKQASLEWLRTVAEKTVEQLKPEEEQEFITAVYNRKWDDVLGKIGTDMPEHCKKLVAKHMHFLLTGESARLVTGSKKKVGK